MHNPELYAEVNLIHRRDVPAYLEKITPKMKWKNTNRVIDIGCGDGSVTRLLESFLPNDYKLLGCDISKNMIDYAIGRYTHERTSFTVLDITDELPEKMKGNFDQVFSFYAINWVRDQKKAFKNIFDLLPAEGGECVIVLVSNNAVFEVYRALTQNSKWSTWVHDIDRFISPYHDSKEPDLDIMNVMKDVGFVDIEGGYKDTNYQFENKNMLKKLLTALNPFEIPEDKYDDFMEDYIQVLNEVQSLRYNNKGPKDTILYYTSVTMYGRKPSSISRP